MRTLMVGNQKGGTGKTTTAVTLAAGAALVGRRVLLVDLDSQGNVADMLGMEKVAGLYGLLIEGAGRGAVVRSGRRGLDVVLGNERTVEVQAQLVVQTFRTGVGPDQVLRKALARMGDEYDLCVLDCAPGVDLLFSSALAAADFLLIPARLRQLSMVGVAALTKRAQDADCTLLGVLPTFLDRRDRETFEQHDWLVKKFADAVWPAVPVDVNVGRAPAFGETLWEFAPGTRALAGMMERDGSLVGGYARVLARMLKEVGLNGRG